MEAMDYLAEFYGSHDEDGRLLSRHGRVEFATTMKYVEKYLRPGMRVLEVGAGTGRYSHALAGQGYQVDAVELLDSNIEAFKRNTQPGEAVSIVQGDARDLGGFAAGAYDMTLLLGPMYHLFTREDQLAALSEAVRVTRPGGVVLAAYCMGDPTIITYGFMRGMIHELLEKCKVDPETFRTFSRPWDIFELYRKEDIEELRGHFPVEPLHFVAADGFTNYIRDTVDGMDEDSYQLYLKYHLAVCERQDLAGCSHHTLDIFRKRA